MLGNLKPTKKLPSEIFVAQKYWQCSTLKFLVSAACTYLESHNCIKLSHCLLIGAQANILLQLIHNYTCVLYSRISKHFFVVEIKAHAPRTDQHGAIYEVNSSCNMKVC